MIAEFQGPREEGGQLVFFCEACGIERRWDAPPLMPYRHDCRILKPTSGGAGTELKKLLAGWPFRFRPEPGCKCDWRAAEMDSRGPDWCEENIETIVVWLKEEADRRGLPFMAYAGHALVRRAIRNARKAVAIAA